MNELIKRHLRENIATVQQMIDNEVLISKIVLLADEIVKCIKNGGKLVICGNGGSASDALHFAGEIVGRFQKERSPWPAVVLNADVATMTAIANDYGYDEIFSRQAAAHLTDKDIFIGISTSGNSKNIYNAVLTAREIGSVTVGILGKDGGMISEVVNNSVIVPSNVAARIQESHIIIIHIICEIVENMLTEAE